MSTKNSDNTDHEDGSEGGEGGKGKGGKGGTGFFTTFDELIAVTPEEADIARYAKEALFSQRVSLKSQGEKVAALDRRQRNRFDDPRMAAEISQGGSNLEAHPELPELGGAFDDIVFPEIEAEAAALNDPELRNELKNRLGMGMSKEALKYEYEKKNKEKLSMSARPAPEQKPEYVIRPAAPPPRPRPF